MSESLFHRPAREAYQRFQRRKKMRSAAIVILIPTAIAFIYYALIARPQYHTEVKFTIQGLKQAAPDVLTGIGIPSLGGGSGAGDGAVVLEYLKSDEFVSRLRQSYGFNQAFAGFTLDPWGHISRSAPVEDATNFWATRNSVQMDPLSSIVTVDINAFRPEDSLNLAKGVLAESSRLVNSLNGRVQDEALKLAQRELAAKEAGYRQARQRMAEARGKTSVTLDAETGQEVAQIGALNAQLAAAKVAQAALTATYKPDSPQMVAGKQQIAQLEAQLAAQTKQVRTGPGTGPAARDVAGQAQILEYDYAQKAYYAALTALQEVTSARSNERRYVVAFVPPRLPETSDYWSRWGNILGIAFASALLLALANLVLSIIRDHTR